MVHLSVGVHDHDHAQVEGAHRTPVRAEAQDVRVREAGEDVVAAEGCCGVLVCQIRVMLHTQGV